MPIPKVSSVITETAPADWDQLLKTGVMRDDDFAVCDHIDKTRQIKFSAAAMSASKSITIAAGANTSDITLTLPTIAGTASVYNPEYDAGNSGASLTVNFANGNAQKITMTASCTFTFSNPAGAQSYVLKLVQGGTGSYTVTWPIAVKWVGSAPTLSTSVGKIDIISFYFDGTNYFGTSSIGY